MTLIKSGAYNSRTVKAVGSKIKLCWRGTQVIKWNQIRDI